MMDKLLQIFIEEASDLIARLEKNLLALETRPDDKGLIGEIFRLMHTLKGNSHMFGFEALGTLTHHLETLYEYVREGKHTVSSALLSLTLSAIDHFKNVLTDPHLQDEGLRACHEDLLRQVEALFDEAALAHQANPSLTAASPKDEEIPWQTYYLYFSPNPGAFPSESDLLLLIDELVALGPHEVIARTPESAEAFWEILLATGAGENALRDVFLLVEAHCQLLITPLANENLFTHPDFRAQVIALSQTTARFGPEALSQLVAELAYQPPSVFPQERAQVQSRELVTSSIRVAADKLDQLLNLVSELVTTQARLSLLAEQKASSELIAVAETVEKLSRQLRDNTFSICLIPLETLVTRFQRLVRDLSSELGKEIILLTEGTDTELDKTIIDSLADPLMHMLRNSIDHGIEETHLRTQKGKPAQGTILLKAFYSGAYVHIQIQDDGAGIEAEKIRRKALEKGLIQPEANLTKKEIFDLIFLPGFSTAARVTDISGRGVGMDVVRRKISEVRGEVEIDAQVDKGTIITIKLPLTLSILDGLLVRIGETPFIIPLSVVSKCYEANHSRLVNTFNPIINLDGEAIPFLYLRNEFEIVGEAPSIEQVVIVWYEDKPVGLVVDQIVGEYQAVLKPLGKLYRNQTLISGASILGDGTIALVMDTHKITKQLAGQTAPAASYQLL